MGATVQIRTITTRIPARLDRLPWSRFHWRIVVGLGGVWVLDAIEVSLVGSVSSRLTQHGSGIHVNAAQVGAGRRRSTSPGRAWVRCFFGRLTDRFGRRSLFMVTLGVYLTAVIATAFAFAPWYFLSRAFSPGLD